MTPGSHRLLGFAFANADLLLEIEPDGRIAFAVGASEALSGSPETKLVGSAWRDFIDQRDRPMVEALFDGLVPGARTGPVVVGLAAGGGAQQAAALSACRLPQNRGTISCTLSRAARPIHAPPGGLHDKTSFAAVSATLFETARATGLELELALLEIEGLEAARKAMTSDAVHDTDRRLAGLLRAQSHGGAAAAALGDDRFAVVRRRTGEAPDALAARLVELLGLDAAHLVRPAALAVALSAEAPLGQVARAIRYCLDVFVREGIAGAPPLSLGEAVARSVRRTLVEAGALSDAVAARDFRLVYQPVVNLKAQGALQHHEALVRFGDNASPFPLIRMAEELDLIEPLDLAIIERAIAKLVGAPELTLAVNISGRTIGSGDFVAQVRAMIAAAPGARGRLIFELTESAAIDDLPLADRHLQALRAEGCRVCLDDFGAGAASLAYLQQLSLDVVKIDGRYIRDLQHGGRESTFIRHLVRMCDDLGVKTLAEMVETSQAEEAVRRAGVDYAQGWLYGPATEEPETPALRGAPTKAAARRGGVMETWG